MRVLAVVARARVQDYIRAESRGDYSVANMRNEEEYADVRGGEPQREIVAFIRRDTFLRGARSVDPFRARPFTRRGLCLRTGLYLFLSRAQPPAYDGARSCMTSLAWFGLAAPYFSRMLAAQTA